MPEYGTTTMDNMNEEQIYRQKLDGIHYPIVQQISQRITDSAIQWKQLPQKVPMQQCLVDDTLIGLLKPLVQMVSVLNL